MKLIIQPNEYEQLIYQTNSILIPKELIGHEFTYQDYINLGSNNSFLKSFFKSEFCNPYWYKDTEGKLIYRRVINNNRGN
jgi:hypothetical protein